jgi:hypothetical protein
VLLRDLLATPDETCFGRDVLQTLELPGGRSRTTSVRQHSGLMGGRARGVQKVSALAGRPSSLRAASNSLRCTRLSSLLDHDIPGLPSSVEPESREVLVRLHEQLSHVLLATAPPDKGSHHEEDQPAGPPHMAALDGGVLTHILSFLDMGDLVVALRVSRTFYQTGLSEVRVCW